MICLLRPRLFGREALALAALQLHDFLDECARQTYVQPEYETDWLPESDPIAALIHRNNAISH